EDIFKKQVLNDHGNEMYHDPLLVSRKELGIPDEEWEVLRDACWIQNEWSASITPKGGFFCEVAGTLDLLFDGPGGWEIEPNWWKRDVSEFGEQLQWCELCGAACDTYTRNANEEVDDVSPLLYEKLKAVESRKVKHNKVHIMDIDEKGVISEESKASTKRFTSNLPYAESVYDKFSENSKLYPKAFQAIVFSSELDEAVLDDLFFTQFQTTYCLCKTDTEKATVTMEQSDRFLVYSLENQDDMKALLTLQKQGIYVAVFGGNLLPKPDFVEQLTKFVFNPGALLYTNDTKDNEMLERFVTVKGEGEFALFNRAASSLKRLGGDFSSIRTIFDMKDIWIPEKVIAVDADLFPKNTFMQVQKCLRYAMYGTGIKAKEDIVAIRNDGGIIACVFDGNAEKRGTTFEGVTIDSSENIVARRDEFDIIVIASFQYYEEIEKTLLERGFHSGEFLYYQHRES
ncbi:MAG: hypothetical protein R3Y53_11735, partial [Bacillota bacterium]